MIQIANGYIPDKSIKEVVKLLARDIDRKIAERERNPIMLGCLNGSFIFMADLVREMQSDCEVKFCTISSYKGNEKQSKIGIQIPFIEKDADIIIIEDIIDSGDSIKHLLKKLENWNPKSVEICTLLKRHTCRDININYVGFELIDDSFVYGYGMDNSGKGRGRRSVNKIK